LSDSTASSEKNPRVCVDPAHHILRRRGRDGGRLRPQQVVYAKVLLGEVREGTLSTRAGFGVRRTDEINYHVYASVRR
jgi:hypothetical protein